MNVNVEEKQEWEIPRVRDGGNIEQTHKNSILRKCIALSTKITSAAIDLNDKATNKYAQQSMDCARGRAQALS